MIVYGIDFSSSPSARTSKAKNAKWMYLASCKLDDNILTVEGLTTLNGGEADDYEELVGLLASEGPWIAGLDVPFGMPIECIEYFQWLLPDDAEQNWATYVERVRALKTRQKFKQAIEGWRHPTKVNASGHQERVRKYRQIDKLINSQSPMNCIRPAVGSMFFEACELLRTTPASVHPVRMVTDERRHIVETYPRLVVDRLLKGSSEYKEAEGLEEVRQQIVAGLMDASDGSIIRQWYGLLVQMDETTANQCVADQDGDRIDSVLCAVQAAWAYKQKSFGVPQFSSSVMNGIIALEGWVPDPFLAKWRAA